MVPCMFLMLPCMGLLRAELLHKGGSFSDFVCMLCSALQGASVRKNPGALQKHPRLLVTIRKRILGQSPAVGTRGAMQITQTSHAATTTTANLFFVVFYSYQRESPSSDFSLSCDGKSVPQDIGASVSS